MEKGLLNPKAALGVALAALVASWGVFFPAVLGKPEGHSSQNEGFLRYSLSPKLGREGGPGPNHP